MQSSDGPAPLQFDTAIGSHAPLQGGAAGGVTCGACGRAIADEYFDAGGQPVCASCREAIGREGETPRGWGVLARAGAFGLVAAMAGAVLYYAVIAITDFEIGLVAIAIGYMVGYGVRMGARGRGGRRFQVAALLLTYWAVGLAYTPFLFQAASEPEDDAVQTETSPAASLETTVLAGTGETGEAAAGAAATEEARPAGAILVLLMLSVALPVIVVLGSLPGGLLSAAIIVFGMMQAWRMTGAAAVQISGPYRVGPGPVAPA